MQVYENGVLKLTKRYVGDYEEEINATSGNIRKIHYLSGGAVWVDNSAAADSLYYAFTDYQGNLTALADASGNTLRQYAYDPWGNRRSAADWTSEDAGKLYFSRGYTMHEHLDRFKLINMNGRMYDPVLASFLSPDPYVQMPDNWLNYNRYSYCFGNPLKYTDPTGEQMRQDGGTWEHMGAPSAPDDNSFGWKELLSLKESNYSIGGLQINVYSGGNLPDNSILNDFGNSPMGGVNKIAGGGESGKTATGETEETKTG